MEIARTSNEVKDTEDNRNCEPMIFTEQVDPTHSPRSNSALSKQLSAITGPEVKSFVSSLNIGWIKDSAFALRISDKLMGC